ncbi:3-deoxy-manno-octulosonate cytidylyltransferase [Rhizobium sp. 16-449-1b]|uniref:3-deoxy-manno-octulosonate cytidylyltransferase n=1 Tax=Rhizobium sp. 16-449-1b TaxID=2819989 RepID=UPI001ADC26E8|nr:3-deoxy-manno-octulosonate cytidylyltransferase [Rhizobium sp. 16-449-1b]MBO9198084.1 3-deoxy-manno-octulosonate cytidylyltransferase [Rhizobium sp. 16-449-1b]
MIDRDGDARFEKANPVAAAAEEWKSLLADYSDVVLVANSDEVNIEDLKARFPDTTLFIFFNKVFKVLNEPFTRHSMLFSRSGTLGANLVKSGKVDKVLPYFDMRTFHGVVNIKAGPDEQLSPASDFGDVHVRHLDLTDVFTPFYPRSSVPTTGFALCFWLTTLNLGTRITLAGFSSKRSERYKVLDVHDWTFEQVLLRLMFRKGKINIVGREASNPYADLSAHFPEFTPADIELTANEIIDERLGNLSSIVDRLMDVTRFLRFLDRTWKSLKPKSRKQRRWEALEPKGDDKG